MKLFGSILILSACICACYFYEKREKNKLDSLCIACDFILHIKSQIEYFSLPLEKIFNSYSNKCEITENLSKNQFKNIQTSFEKDDFRIICDFFKSLGKGYKNQEISLCSYTLEELGKNLKKEKAEYPNKIKVFRVMTLFIGFCVIILLI